MVVRMPGGNFNPELEVHPDGVVEAAGPLDESVAAVSEMCVWVLQREGADDAIANAMGAPEMPGVPHMDDDMPEGPAMADMHGGLKVFDLGTPDAHRIFPLTHRFKRVGFRGGSATALAIGVFVDDEGGQRSFFWSEPVSLKLHAKAST
jgi:hypothetical protein